MIQEMINSENSKNTTESTNTNIFRTFHSVEVNVRTLTVLMIEVYFNCIILLFISNPYICDPKRAKFHSNDPVFEFTIFGF